MTGGEPVVSNARIEFLDVQLSRIQPHNPIQSIDSRGARATGLSSADRLRQVVHSEPCPTKSKHGPQTRHIEPRIDLFFKANSKHTMNGGNGNDKRIK